MYLHGGDWERIRDTLLAVDAPVNSKRIGIANDVILKAFIKSKEIRPQRLTILDRVSDMEIEEAALVTGVIS